MNGGERYLLTDCWSCTDPTESLTLAEGKELATGRVRFQGPYTECDRRNRNNRIYPNEIMRPEFEDRIQLVERRRLTGELDHPDDSIVHLERLSHRVTKLWWDPKNPAVGFGEAVTLRTPFGMVAESLFHEDVPIGVSSRGVGAGKPGPDGSLIIQPGFKLVTWDLVSDPSYQDAWQTVAKEITESVLKACAVGRVSVSMATPAVIRQERVATKPVTNDQVEAMQEAATFDPKLTNLMIAMKRLAKAL